MTDATAIERGRVRRELIRQMLVTHGPIATPLAGKHIRKQLAQLGHDVSLRQVQDDLREVRMTAHDASLNAAGAIHAAVAPAHAESHDERSDSTRDASSGLLHGRSGMPFWLVQKQSVSTDGGREAQVCGARPPATHPRKRGPASAVDKLAGFRDPEGPISPRFEPENP